MVEAILAGTEVEKDKKIGPEPKPADLHLPFRSLWCLGVKDLLVRKSL